MLARGTFTVSGLVQRPAAPRPRRPRGCSRTAASSGPCSLAHSRHEAAALAQRSLCPRREGSSQRGRPRLPTAAGSDRVAAAAAEWLSARQRLWQWRCSPWQPASAPPAAPPNHRRQALLLPAGPRQLVRPFACRVKRPILSWAVQIRRPVPSRARSPCYHRLSSAPRSSQYRHEAQASGLNASLVPLLADWICTL